MISFQQLRSYFFATSLSVLLATIMAFGFGSADSWADTSLAQLIGQPQTQIATNNSAKVFTKNIEGQTQEAIDNITDNPLKKSDGKAEQLEAKTLKATGVSMDNPNYRPGGKTKQVEKQERKASEGIKAEARGALNKDNNKD